MSESDKFDPRTPKGSDELNDALDTLQQVLESESWFFDRVRAMVAVKYPTSRQRFDKTDFPTLGAKEGHDNLLHLVQFFFFLEALDCTTPDAVLRFIKAHNDKIEIQLKNGDIQSSPSELGRAIFKSKRIVQVSETIEYFRRPVFAKREIGDLLFDTMSPRTTENLINDLVKAGMLKRRGDGETEDPPGTTDPSRFLVQPHEFFVNCYIESLQRLRRGIVKSALDQDPDPESDPLLSEA